MIRLSDINGRTILLAPEAIAQVTEAGASQAWHGVRANVKTFDGERIEVRETVDAVNEQMERAYK